MSYNVNEKKGDNHFNCPVVAYYPQTIENNVKAVEEIRFISSFIGIHDPKIFKVKIEEILADYSFSKADISKSIQHRRTEPGDHGTEADKKIQNISADAAGNDRREISDKDQHCRQGGSSLNIFHRGTSGSGKSSQDRERQVSQKQRYQNDKQRCRTQLQKIHGKYRRCHCFRDSRNVTNLTAHNIGNSTSGQK